MPLESPFIGDGLLAHNVGMVEQASAVLEEIPNDEDVQGEDGDHGEAEAVQQFVDFNGYEENGFTNGEPSCPDRKSVV